MRIMRQLAKIMLALLCTFTLTVVVLPLVYSAHAAANSTPSLTASSSTVPIQADGCVKVTLIGSGFTPGNKIYLRVPINNRFYEFASTIPGSVFPDVQGKFILPVKACIFTLDFSPLDSITIEAATAKDLESFGAEAATTVTLTSPDPVIHAVSNTVSVDFGCATVRLVGNGFIPSTFLTNYVFFTPLNLPVGRIYGEGNVLGDGNIALSFSICRVTPDQTLTIYGSDLASRKFSNVVTVQTVKFA